MKIKLYKAIKLKNQLSGELKDIAQKIQAENTIVVGNERAYNISDLLAKYDDKMDCLIKVKTAIHLANNAIYHKICLMSELKLQATNLKRLACTHGPNTEYKNYREHVITEFNSELTKLERDNLVKTIEKKISSIQDELDEYNYNTEIEVVSVC